MRRLFISLVVLCSMMLTSCGGRGSGPVEAIRIASVTRIILLRFLQAPSSLDEVLLGRLAGTVSTGLNTSGKPCSVSFSSSLLQIVSAGYLGSLANQPASATGAKDTTYVYVRFYDAKTGAFNFAVNASNGGAENFWFQF